MSVTIAVILLLLILAPINCFIKSEEVSIAILFIFSGDVFLTFSISASTIFTSFSIYSSRCFLFISMSFNNLFLASLYRFFASIFDFKIILSNSFNLASL